jgi:hypothetical protein
LIIPQDDRFQINSTGELLRVASRQLFRITNGRIDRSRINVHQHNIPLCHFFTRASLETIPRAVQALIKENKCDNVFVKRKNEWNIILQS